MNLLAGMFQRRVLPILQRLSLSTSAEEWDDLIRRCDHLYLINLQTPYIKKNRYIQRPPTKMEKDGRSYQSRTGFVSEDILMQTLSIGNNSGGVRCLRIGKSRCLQIGTMTPFTITSNISNQPSRHDIASWERIIGEFEDMYGVKIRRVNGTPYPFNGSMFVPQNWSWPIFCQFIEGRFV
jgi:hypothetical protein